MRVDPSKGQGEATPARETIIRKVALRATACSNRGGNVLKSQLAKVVSVSVL